MYQAYTFEHDMSIVKCSSGEDVCAGGSRYNQAGIIVAGLPNTVNSLAAIKEVVFEQGASSMANPSTRPWPQISKASRSCGGVLLARRNRVTVSMLSTNWPRR